MITVEVHAVDTYVSGIVPGSTMERAVQACTFYLAPGFDRDPRHVYGQWDGKMHTFTQTEHPDTHCRVHHIPTGLVPKLLHVFRRSGAAYHVESKVPRWTKRPELKALLKANFQCRPYQTQATVRCIKPQADFGRLGGILEMATGAGKTRVAAKLIQMMQGYTVFLVDQIDLVNQTIAEFETLLGVPIGKIGDGVFDFQPITVASIQTVCMAAGYREKGDKESLSEDRLEMIRSIMEHADLVIIDEAHKVAAQTAQAAVALAKNAVSFVGLSASPWRDDGLDLLIEAACGPVVYKISASDLIDMGYLMAPEITVHKLPEPDDEDTMSMDTEKFHKFYRAWVVDNLDRNMYIGSLADVHVRNGDTVIILVKQFDHGMLLEGLIHDSVFVQGRMSGKKRKEVFARVRSGEVRVLIATSLADQGLDLPRANVLILAGGGKSSTKALQRIGRVLRMHPDKTAVWVHDIADCHPTWKRQLTERMRIYRGEPRFKVRTKAVNYATSVDEIRGLVTA